MASVVSFTHSGTACSSAERSHRLKTKHTIQYLTDLSFQQVRLFQPTLTLTHIVFIFFFWFELCLIDASCKAVEHSTYFVWSWGLGLDIDIILLPCYQTKYLLGLLISMWHICLWFLLLKAASHNNWWSYFLMLPSTRSDICLYPLTHYIHIFVKVVPTLLLSQNQQRQRIWSEILRYLILHPVLQSWSAFKEISNYHDMYSIQYILINIRIFCCPAVIHCIVILKSVLW